MSSQTNKEGEMGFEFNWKIEWTDLQRKKFNEVMESPVFALVKNGIRYLWTLQLYPKGEKREKFPSADRQPYISVFLRRKEGSVKADVDANFQFFIKGGNKMEQVRDKFNLSQALGYPDFCLQSSIRMAESVVFGVRIWLKESAFDVERLFPDPKFQNIQKNRLLYQQIVLGDRSRGQATGDCTIVVSNKDRIRCHQLFLREASPVFQTIFQQRRWAAEVRINDIPLETVKRLLFYCYVDAMPEGWEENAVGLLRAAHKYDIAAVMVKCEKELAACLELDNAVEMLMLAVELRLKLLGMQATQLLVDNWSEVTAKDQKAVLRQEQAARELINSFDRQKNVTFLGH